MKTRIVALLAGLSLVACGPAAEAPENQIPDSEVSRDGDGFEAWQASLPVEAETGLRIVDFDSVYAYGSKELRGYYEAHVKRGQLIVHTVNGVDAKWSDAQKVNLTYCVSSTAFGANYNRAVTDMTAAANAWEAVANVNFVHNTAQDSNCTASNANVVFDVRPVNSGGQYLARAFFPNDTRANRNVLIDNSAFGSIPPWTLAGILRHELGHTLGFRHEHTRPNSGTCFEDNNWRALTSYDPNSVMHYPQCNGTQQGDLVITALDAQGAALLYGAPGGGGGGGGDTVTTETRTGSVTQGQTANVGTFSVKPGTAFEVIMTGSGDPDLYVRRGALPTTSTYDCRPYLGGASETCSLNTNTSTTMGVMVYGYTAGSYTLTIKYVKGDGGGGGGTPTTVNYANQSVAASTNKFYPATGSFAVRAGTTFRAAMSGGTGDADLYVRWGAQPTTSAYNCRPYLNGNTETCELSVPAGVTSAYVMVRGYTAASGFNLSVTHTP